MGVRKWRKRILVTSATIAELVKRLEARVGGNVKVGEWPIEWAAASGQTGLSLCLSLAVLAAATFLWKTEETRILSERERVSLLIDTETREKAVGGWSANYRSSRRFVWTLSKEVLVSARVKGKAAKLPPALTCPFRAKTMESLV